MFFYIFILFFNYFKFSSSSSSSSLFQPIQSANLITSINIPFFQPEGLSYHINTDRIILSSFSTGFIRSLSNNLNNNNNNLLNEINENNTILLYSGSYNNIFTPIVGIKVYNDILYGAIGSIPPLQGPFYGGLLILDLNNPSNVNLIDFSSEYNGKLMTPNDVTLSTYSNAIFVTDFYSYRIFRVDLATSSVSTFFSSNILCSICSTTTFAYDGPNGIATKDDYLLVARSGTISLGTIPAIIKVPINNPSSATVLSIYPTNTSTQSILDGADGLIFDSNNEVLYLTSNGKGIIVAIRSTYGTTNEWSSGQVIFTYNARCTYNDPSTSTIVSSTGDLILICTEQFGSGPYVLNRLPGIANNYNAVESFSYNLKFPYLIPESLTYQPSTDSILYSSFGLGNIYSTNNPSIPISSGYSKVSNTIEKIIDINILNNGLLGIQVDNKYDHLIWGAFTNASRTSAGIYRADTNTGKYQVYFLDTVSTGTYTSFYNDVSIDNYDGTTYATEMRIPHKIISIKPSNRLDITSSLTISTVATNICIDCSETCDGTGDCGPNGIAVVQNGKKKAKTLITGAFSFNPDSNGLYSIDISTGVKTLLQAIPNTFVQRLDGIRFDDEGEFLFVASYGINTITAYYSCDNWKQTIYVAGVFKGGCSDGTNTAVTYTSSGDLIITCVNNFGSGPYTSTRITNIKSRLLGISYSSIEDFCEGDEPFDTDSNDNDNNNDNDEDNEWSITIIILIILTIFCGIFAITFSILYFLQFKSKSSGSIAEMTKTDNILHP